MKVIYKYTLPVQEKCIIELPKCALIIRVEDVAGNDGLSHDDFLSWFDMHPKKNGPCFSGQIITWSSTVDYTPQTIPQNS